ncbi:MAG: gamma-glutamyltransferase [Sphingomonadales bacterium]|nr:gamma-glutamyltransferase [Sphingomonadales bacterium]
MDLPHCCSVTVSPRLPKQSAPHDRLTRWLVPALAALLLAAPGQARTPARHERLSPKAEVSGTGVVSAADPRAAAAGVEMLRRGGTATDAAIATMLALNVVEPQNSGIGGGAFFLRHDSRTGTIATIDGRETAPAAATPNWFLGADGKPLAGLGAGGKSAGVPGELALMAQAHARYGRLPWASLFGPAIRLARDGTPVSARMHNGLNLYGRHVEGWARSLYFNAAGEAVAKGTLLKVPELAATLERLAQQGPKPFYTGALAAHAVTALNQAQAHPSPITRADFAGYRAIARAPVCGSYRGWRICGMGPPSAGGISVLMILKQIERFDIGAMGRASPQAWHLFAESSRLAYADRNRYIADPAFVTVPTAGLLDGDYLARRSALIAVDRTMATILPGEPAGAPTVRPVARSEDKGTSDLAVVDRDGNVVQVTTTINGYFGAGVAADGYMLNNELPDFDVFPDHDGVPAANRVEGGKRPRSSMAPTFAYAPDGQLRLAIGAAGGSTIIAQVAKALVAVIDWHMSAQDAIALGLVYAPGPGGTIEQGTGLETLQPGLAALGEKLRVGPLGLKANAVERVGTGPAARWVGAADPRSEGVGMDTTGAVTVIPRRSNELNGAHE